jgi:hypothetical protein
MGSDFVGAASAGESKGPHYEERTVMRQHDPHRIFGVALVEGVSDRLVKVLIRAEVDPAIEIASLLDLRPGPTAVVVGRAQARGGVAEAPGLVQQ